MDKKLKSAWVKDLRSDRRNQTQKRLRNNDNGRCCLGVLCEVSKLGMWKRNDEGVFDYVTKDGEPIWNSAESIAAPKFRKYFGLVPEQADTLTSLNDIGDYNITTGAVTKFTFKKIADWIEKNI